MALEPHFIKSVLPIQEILLSSEANDTSLVVPTEEKITTSRHLLSERSLRVQQQVQHTLARKGRLSSYSSPRVTSSSKSLSSYGMTNGHSFHLNRNPSHGRLVTYDGGNTFSWKVGVKSPMQRVDVTPDASPVLLRAHLGQRAQRHSQDTSWVNGSFTMPAARPSVMEQSPRTLAPPSHRYAHSEVVRGTRLYSTIHGAVNRPANQPLSQPRPRPRPAVPREDFLVHSTPYRSTEAQRVAMGSYGTHRQTGGQLGWQTGGPSEGQSGVGGQDTGSLAWLNQVTVRRDSHRTDGERRESCPGSVVSMELDTSVKKAVVGQQAQQTAVTERKAEGQGTAMTVEKAISLLAQDDVDVQVSAASFLQQHCFNSAEAKKKVSYLHGIQKLLALLQSDSEELEHAASGALRNIVYESNQNKMEVRDCEGVPAILSLLTTSRDTDTRRQLTGLLWNLSSHDQLKEYLLREALTTLTESVMVPCSGINEGENPKEDLLADAEVFYNTTGCLRNLSSSGPDGRKVMRERTGLIDALIYYVRGTIADYQPDDKTTENCVCILHNLSYQLEAELPLRYAGDLYTMRDAATIKTKTPGCFPGRSVEIVEQQEHQRPLLEDKSNPSGAEWLWSAITTRMYLSLIARSSRQCTQEASVGALQNLTAGNGAIAESLAHVVVQKEGGLSQLKTLLEDGEMDIKKTTASLLRNLSRFREHHSEIIKQVLPELLAMLPSSDMGTDLPMDVTVSLCHILINLCQADTQSARAVVNHGALPKIISISTRDNGYGPTRAAQTAGVLLHTMWNQVELRGAYKKAGYRKSDFINSRTLKAQPARD
ncbi:plakophilin-2 isoform X3 [Alosa sapidissima]|uniref:plakophilin-2 isoform X3 n=1 Tax=Alosa sapidissima TaxID=34773 RepID=UPI001C088A46|nr:plakophilin-2 isoform X3 [Alosa sapidissima]